MRIAPVVFAVFLAFGSLSLTAESRAQVAVGVSVQIAPPALPVYEQPICPEPDYIWVPGYWAYGPDGYFWVPGTWVEPPEVGLLWTPGYWAWEDDFYVWHPGYWGPEVGFYGGIDYGFGYTGVGFFGGYWRGRTFYYNRAVTRVDVNIIHNTYHTTVVNNNVNRVSFNGGRGGIVARPTTQEMGAERGRHVQMTSEQMQHQHAASTNRTFLASVNHGRPDVAATARPGGSNGRNAVSSGPPPTTNRPRDNRMETRPEANTAPVNPTLNPRQQRDMDTLRQRQDAERQKIQQRQAQEQQRMNRQNANQERQDQLQQRQQQQMEQMNRKHDQQTQKLQEHQQRDVQKQQQREQKNQSAPKHQDH
ncbi:MAG TPA: YXWGXW repeat-containing protein [Candidatus Acidoferrales bacterium]|nr:YXWGXW repeat-containing protein [Candidatus Acidoferrales bacterium]